MPYTDDPQNVPADRVRFLVGDTDVAHPKLSDGEVAFLLDDQNGSEMRAAARGAETLSAKYANLPSEKSVGPLSLMYGTRAVTISDAYAKLAKMLWAQASAQSSVPFAGGINVTDKLIRAEDTERTRPFFARRMMHYPNGNPQSVTPEEILSPSQEIP